MKNNNKKVHGIESEKNQNKNRQKQEVGFAQSGWEHGMMRERAGAVTERRCAPARDRLIPETGTKFTKVHNATIFTPLLSPPISIFSFSPNNPPPPMSSNFVDVSFSLHCVYFLRVHIYIQMSKYIDIYVLHKGHIPIISCYVYGSFGSFFSETSSSSTMTTASSWPLSSSSPIRTLH